MAETVQLDFNFEPGLVRQFPELIDLVVSCVYSYRGGLLGTANAIGISQSHLSRILTRKDPEDVRHFSINWLPVVIQYTGDKRPISWLIEKFMEDPETTRKQTLSEMALLAGRLSGLLEAEGIKV